MTPSDPSLGAVADAPNLQAATPEGIVRDPTGAPPALAVDPAAPPAASSSSVLARRLWLRDLSAIAALAALMRLIFSHAAPGPDQTYALIWGRDLIHGRTPDFTSPFSSTAHPLSTLMAGFAALLGHNGAVDALEVVSYLSLGAVIWGTFSLGEMVFSRAGAGPLRARLAAIAAVLVVATSFGVLGVAVNVYLDMPYLAIIVWAAVLELRRPRRGTLVLVLLTLGGLLRPEAAVLAAAYWIYACWHSSHRWRSALIVLVAPLGWLAMALAVTGHPLFTISAQRLITAQHPASANVSSLSSQLSAFQDALRLAIRGTALIGAALGVLLAIRLRAVALVLPAVVTVLVFLTYLGFIVLGLAVPDRMLLTPGVMLALFWAFAVIGWGGIRSLLERSLWAAAGIGVAVVIVVTAPGTIDGLIKLDGHVAGQQRVISSLGALEQSPAARKTLRFCRSVSVDEAGLIPYVAYYLDLPLQRFSVSTVTVPTHGVYVAASNRRDASFLVGHQYGRQAALVPPGFERVAGDRSWTIYTHGC